MGNHYASHFFGRKMRLDKFLKNSRIIKRRTVANEACDNARVSVNGKTAKASYNVKPDDIISINFGGMVHQYRVISAEENVTKDKAREMYEILN